MDRMKAKTTRGGVGALARWMAVGLCALGGAACSPAGGGFPGLDMGDRAVRAEQPSVTRPPPMAIANTEIPWDQLRPRLAEAAGGLVVEEVILDHQVKAELARQGLTVSDDEVARERELLLASLQRGAGADAEQSARLVGSLQQSRGLGPVRFRALLERNAMLRRLVRDGIEIDPAEVGRALIVKYGPRVKCRLIVVPTEGDARRLLARLQQAGAELEERFSAEARLVSVDPSASLGGQVDPISPEDPSYAQGVRKAAEVLGEGQLSQILMLDNGYALLLGQGAAAPVEPPASARADAEADLRLRAERMAMDRLAQRLINSAPVTVFDPSLGWSWQVRVLKPGP